MLLDENDSHALQRSKPKSQNGKQIFLVPKHLFCVLWNLITQKNEILGTNHWNKRPKTQKIGSMFTLNEVPTKKQLLKTNVSQ